MRSRRIRARLWKFALLLAAAGVLVAYLNVGILPGRLNEVAAKHLEAFFGRTVTFKRVVYLPFRGISIDGLKTAASDGSAVFTSKRMLLRVPLVVFLADSRLVIRKAVLDKPYLLLTLPPGGADSGSPARPAAAAATPRPPGNLAATFLEGGADSLLPENVYLERLVVVDGKAVIRRGKSAPVPVEFLDGVCLDVDFRRTPRIPVKGSLTLGDPAYGRIAFEGVWTLGGKAHEVRLKGQLNRMPAWATEKFSGADFSLRTVRSDFDVRVVSDKAGRYGFRFSARDARTSLRWKNTAAAGAGSVRLEGSYDAASKRVVFTQGSAEVRDASLAGLPPPIGRLEKIRGALRFTGSEIQLTKCTASWEGVPFGISGSLGTAEGDPFRLRITQRSDDLAFLERLVPAAARRHLDLSSASGRVEIDGELEGKAGNFDAVKRNFRVSLSGVNWRPPGSKTGISGLRGAITAGNDRVDASNFAFSWGREKFSAAGRFDLRAGKASALSLRHPAFRADARFVLAKDAAAVERLDLAAGKTLARLGGRLGFGGELPFELEGKIGTDLADIAGRLQQSWPVLQPLAPHGAVRGSVKLSGGLLKPASLRLKLACESAEVGFGRTLEIADPVLDVEYAGGVLTVPYGRGTLYGGEMRVSGWAETRRAPDGNFRISLTCDGADLSRAAGDFDFLDPEFAGLLNLDLELKGNLRDRASVFGSGNFDVRYGRLFTTPLFRRLKNLVFVRIEGIDNVTFHRAEGTFSVADGRIATDDTLLSSPLIDIQMSGMIGLDKSLKLLVRSRFTPDVIRQSNELGGLAPYIVNYAEGKITEYSVTGTLLKPVYTEL